MSRRIEEMERDLAEASREIRERDGEDLDERFWKARREWIERDYHPTTEELLRHRRRPEKA